MNKKNKKPKGETMKEPVESATPTADEVVSATKETAQAEEVEIVENGSTELEKALSKQEEYLSLAQRVQADFENFRRRNQNVRKEAFDDGAIAFATTLLPIIDNMERALAAAKDTTDTALKDGVEMVYRQLMESFEKRGITVIDRKGEPFDPNLENAVLQGTSEDGTPGTVCEVFQKGYILDKRVLRHAMVKVVPE